MMKFFLPLLCLISWTSFSQSLVTGIPDSVQNISHPSSNGSYTISNPLNHTANGFSNAPTTLSCVINCSTDYLYFHDMDFNIPSGATITGIEVVHKRGGCNAGSFAIDTLHLAHNGTIISAPKRDTASTTELDTLGASNDLWSATLTPQMLNDPSFGVFVHTNSIGTCTYSQFDVQVRVHFLDCTQGGSDQQPADSAQNVALSGSNGGYSITNPLGHTGSAFTNAPVTTGCTMNCISDYLYLYDFGFNIPPTSNILGVEVIHTRGGCNAGSYAIDTLHLAHNGTIISGPKRDTASTTETDTLGSATDLWSSTLTAAMVNDPSFGVFINTQTVGICTYGQFDVQIILHYCEEASSSVEEQVRIQVDLFPNPVSEELQVRTEAHVVSPYTIVDVTGRLVQQGVFSGQTASISVVSWPKGVYMMYLENIGVTKQFVVR